MGRINKNGLRLTLVLDGHGHLLYLLYWKFQSSLQDTILDASQCYVSAQRDVSLFKGYADARWAIVYAFK